MFKLAHIYQIYSSPMQTPPKKVSCGQAWMKELWPKERARGFGAPVLEYFSGANKGGTPAKT
jgi:hypothetical protein